MSHPSEGASAYGDSYHDVAEVRTDRDPEPGTDHGNGFDHLVTEVTVCSFSGPLTRMAGWNLQSRCGIPGNLAADHSRTTAAADDWN